MLCMIGTMVDVYMRDAWLYKFFEIGWSLSGSGFAYELLLIWPCKGFTTYSLAETTIKTGGVYAYLSL